MLNYDLSEVAPHVRTWEALTHPEDFVRAKGALEAHLQGRSPFFEEEIRMRVKSGQWRWILDRGKVVEWDAAGNPLRAAGTHLDITDRKAAEGVLRDVNAKLQASIARANTLAEEACTASHAKSE
jgi:PAS domain-containing protein